MTRIDVSPTDAESQQLWLAVRDLANSLPGDWVLIGGLMVQLHAMEHGIADVRVTRDIDILGQARPPGPLSAIDEALRANGFGLIELDADGFAYRYERGDTVVDVLAPDGINPPPTLGGGLKAVGVPGGTQALKRSEIVTVRVAEAEFRLRRPTLLGAILIKSRSITRHADPEAQREDLLRLLALVPDPSAMAREIRPPERKWLRRAEVALDFDGPTTLDADIVRLARLTYLRLLAVS